MGSRHGWKGGVATVMIKIRVLEQGFMEEQEKRGGPLDGQPTWQEPQIKQTNNKTKLS